MRRDARMRRGEREMLGGEFRTKRPCGHSGTSGDRLASLASTPPSVPSAKQPHLRNASWTRQTDHRGLVILSPRRPCPPGVALMAPRPMKEGGHEESTARRGSRSGRLLDRSRGRRATHDRLLGPRDVSAALGGPHLAGVRLPTRDSHGASAPSRGAGTSTGPSPRSAGSALD